MQWHIDGRIGNLNTTPLPHSPGAPAFVVVQVFVADAVDVCVFVAVRVFVADAVAEGVALAVAEHEAAAAG